MSMEKYLDIGGVCLRLTAPEGEVALGRTLEPFLTRERAYTGSLHICLADALPQPRGALVFDDPERRVYAEGDCYVSYVGSTGAPYLRICRGTEGSQAQVLRSEFTKVIGDKILLAAMEVEHLLSAGDSLLLHASFVEVGGEAVLFTAPSGTGKSTQAELWHCLRGARILNGDRAAVKKTAAGFEARGVPFSGTSGICHPAALPLKAVVCLSQAPETKIEKLTGLRAFRRIWEGCSLHTWNRADVEQSTRTVSALLDRVPVYHLACTPDVSAVEALEAVL